ncbi:MULTISPECIES: inovirus Gp2 family protein [Enterobacteriaceae]|uniref:inovirus Gp2 family protein n=1 Tax=Enterobacteriaceae TaxID=543 RepID=UPI000F81D52A|nr:MULTISPECIES: inovirus Gp2 family protein [Enterobacteriaceae]ELY6251240.1 inovirus Gp2 family protein [Cronobacter sakazakii]ELO0984153.1 inovirus Gp2 family protein [Enterobacter asburiae]MBJ9262457.1 inovirus Gp2 family protein [Citrobacter braakii]MCV3772706.1 inovirus Gp2 family protein [Enterobacter sp. RD4-1-1]RTN78798.1 inovirus Gp2 family protein [Enterobacter asburiae]
MSYVELYRSIINRSLSLITNRHQRVAAFRVDTHFPGIVDNGDNICCFHSLEPGEISRMCKSMEAKLIADIQRKEREGKRVYRGTVIIIWAREFSLSGKCHYHLCLLFNKDAYYHLGDYEQENTLRAMITGAWYSAMGLQLDDHPGLVHFPENCRYVLNSSHLDFQENYQELLNRLDYLAKIETKIFGEGYRNFGSYQIDL